MLKCYAGLYGADSSVAHPPTANIVEAMGKARDEFEALELQSAKWKPPVKMSSKLQLVMDKLKAFRREKKKANRRLH